MFLWGSLVKVGKFFSYLLVISKVLILMNVHNEITGA